MKHAAFSNAFNADFDEGKHKRDDSGRFSKSGGDETHVKVDVVKSEAPSKEKAAPTGSPPEPLGKVYRKQVETLIGTDTKEAKALKTVYSQLLEAKSAEEQTKLKGEVKQDCKED